MNCFTTLASETLNSSSIQKQQQIALQNTKIQLQSDVQSNTTLTQLFRTIKNQITQPNNKSICNVSVSNQRLEQLEGIFLKHAESDDQISLKVVVMVLNLLCVVMYNRESGKMIFKRRNSLNCFLNLQLQPIIKINPRISNSICYLLSLIADYDEITKYHYENRYKAMVLNFFRISTQNVKLTYNTLKLVHKLQKKQMISDKIFLKYDILNYIFELYLKFDNWQVQTMCSKIIVRQNQVNKLLQFVNDNRLKINLEALCTAFIQNSELLTTDQLIQIITVAEEGRAIEGIFILIGLKLKMMRDDEFMKLLEFGLIDNVLGRRDSAKLKGMEIPFMNVIKEILKRGKHFYFYECLYDKLEVCGFYKYFIDCTSDCQNRQLYSVLREMYLEFLKERLANVLPINVRV